MPNWIPTSLRARWLLGTVVVLALVLAVAMLRPRTKAVSMVSVQRADLTQTVVATGRVNLPARVDVASEVTATIQQVAVREGDRVKAGSLLVQLADAEARATLEQAQAALAEARARQTQQRDVSAPMATAALTQAEAALKVAQAEHHRATDLVAQGFYSQQKLDDARKALDTARSAVDSARSQALAQQPQGVEVQLIQTRRVQAEAAVQAAQARLARLRLLAPMDAVVLNRVAEPGGLAQPSKVLLSLGSMNGPRIDAGVDERHLGLLAPGLAARAVADAFPAQPFEARLDWVSPSVDATRGTVEVRLAIPQPPAFLRPDMTVSVDMTVGRQPQALVLDASAVRDLDSATPWALVAQDGVARRVPLQLGLRGVGQVEIKQGLAEGDRVIPATEKAEPGDRVRPSTQAAAPMSLGMGR
jgi:HlyD family secretion protein